LNKKLHTFSAIGVAVSLAGGTDDSADGEGSDSVYQRIRADGARCQSNTNLAIGSQRPPAKSET
jgi:hypothetical protein